MVGADGSTLIMLKLYMGNGSLMLLFAASLIYLLIVEKSKERKAVIVYVSIAVLALFFCPLLSYYVTHTMNEEEIYYRLLWILPMGVVIAYAAITFLGKIKKKWIQAVLFVLFVAYVAVGGHLVYKSPQFSRAQNLYQVPDAVIEICDAVTIPGREIMAVFPHELVQYVRQYTPMVVMPYGYDALVERWGMPDELEQEMRKEVSDVERLAMLSRERGCHYIVINQGHELNGRMEDYEFVLVLQVEGYDVYQDKYADLWTPESLGL